MQIQSILNDIVTILNSLKIPYMLSGSLAGNIYSIPRTTRDIDLVAEIKIEDAEKFISAIDGRFYYNPETIIGEINRKGFFNIIDTLSSFKIDFIMLSNSSYEKQKFTRRKKIFVEDTGLWVITIEDLIISKLIWMQVSESELQKSDIKSLLLYPVMDLEYIKYWIEELKLKTFGLI